MTSIWNVVPVSLEFAPAVIGEGATILSYTDRTACTIIAVSLSGKTATIQEDTATRADDRGMSDAQTWTYTANPTGTLHVCKLGKRGWKSAGRKVWMGERDEHYDYSF